MTFTATCCPSLIRTALWTCATDAGILPSTMPATFTPTLTAALKPVATARILYADTDQMGIVYHASFFRYLELARINLLRRAGVSYAEFERSVLRALQRELG